MKTCTECARSALRLRKGRCDACYMRLYRGGEIAEGAACVGCGERRRHVLVNGELAGAPVVVCGNCALVLARARPRPDSVDALRRRARRERRLLPDRRAGGAGAWSGPERRVAPRRAGERFAPPPAYDPSID